MKERRCFAFCKLGVIESACHETLPTVTIKRNSANGDLGTETNAFAVQGVIPSLFPSERLPKERTPDLKLPKITSGFETVSIPVTQDVLAE